MDKLTQKKQILEYLRKNKGITPLEALKEFGCMRLGARIWDLRHDGHTIETVPTTEKRNGVYKSYATYVLID